MPVNIQKILSKATDITKLTPLQDNRVKPAKKHSMQHEQVNAAPDEPNNLTKVSMARLLASCGDCV